MKKYFIPMQHTHFCVAGLYFYGGNIVENRENRGISHLLEHMIFRRLDTAEDEGALPESEQAGI